MQPVGGHASGRPCGALALPRPRSRARRLHRMSFMTGHCSSFHAGPFASSRSVAFAVGRPGVRPAAGSGRGRHEAQAGRGCEGLMPGISPASAPPPVAMPPTGSGAGNGGLSWRQVVPAGGRVPSMKLPKAMLAWQSRRPVEGKTLAEVEEAQEELRLPPLLACEVIHRKCPGRRHQRSAGHQPS